MRADPSSRSDGPSCSPGLFEKINWVVSLELPNQSLCTRTFSSLISQKLDIFLVFLVSRPKKQRKRADERWTERAFSRLEQNVEHGLYE